MDSQRSLHRYATMTAVATFLLLIAGSLVTSTDSGLAVPDWPLSYGTWFPPMVGGILYEHGHRVIAGLVAIMMLILTVWTARTESRRWVPWLGYSALTAVVLQALLGGLTVLLLLPPQVSIAHACLGQAVFCLIVSLAWVTSPHWRERPSRFANDERPSLRTLAITLGVLTALQLLLGAIIRHTGTGVPAHLSGALTLVIATGWFVHRVARRRESLPTVWTYSWRLLVLLVAQVILGMLVLIHRGAIMLRTAHVGIGALILAQTMVLVWETIRRTSLAASTVTTVPRSAEMHG